MKRANSNLIAETESKKEEDKSDISEHPLVSGDSSEEDNEAQIEELGRMTSGKSTDRELNFKTMTKKVKADLFEEEKHGFDNTKGTENLPIKNDELKESNTSQKESDTKHPDEESKSTTQKEPLLGEQDQQEKDNIEDKKEEVEEPKSNDPNSYENLQAKAKELYEESKSFPKEAREWLFNICFYEVYEKTRIKTMHPESKNPAEAQFTEDQTYCNDIYFSINRDYEFDLLEGNQYTSAFLREKYEIAVWDVRKANMAKRDFKYFSIEGHSLQISKADSQRILISAKTDR